MFACSTTDESPPSGEMSKVNVFGESPAIEATDLGISHRKIVLVTEPSKSKTFLAQRMKTKQSLSLN